jgi:hypothetical protein
LDEILETDVGETDDGERDGSETNGIKEGVGEVFNTFFV